MYEVQLRKVQQRAGVNSLTGWVTRVAINLLDFFMSLTGFIETRVIHVQLKFRFAGTVVIEMPLTGCHV